MSSTQSSVLDDGMIRCVCGNADQCCRRLSLYDATASYLAARLWRIAAFAAPLTRAAPIAWHTSDGCAIEASHNLVVLSHSADNIATLVIDDTPCADAPSQAGRIIVDLSSVASAADAVERSAAAAGTALHDRHRRFTAYLCHLGTLIDACLREACALFTPYGACARARQVLRACVRAPTLSQHVCLRSVHAGCTS